MIGEAKVVLSVGKWCLIHCPVRSSLNNVLIKAAFSLHNNSAFQPFNPNLNSLEFPLLFGSK